TGQLAVVAVCLGVRAEADLRIPENRVSASIVPGSLGNVALRRLLRSGIVCGVPVGQLGEKIVEIRPADGHIVWRRSDSAYLQPVRCGLRRCALEEIAAC